MRVEVPWRGRRPEHVSWSGEEVQGRCGGTASAGRTHFPATVGGALVQYWLREAKGAGTGWARHRASKWAARMADKTEGSKTCMLAPVMGGSQHSFGRMTGDGSWTNRVLRFRWVETERVNVGESAASLVASEEPLLDQ